ncbi:MAG TPA: dTDP-4-dehydrorhamnose 3,5-epimerase [bacterium]|nr:dTDP-4-dehydrorhamnose 3,5-epimerase [bacterium]HPQ67113.1 dTDP-4-dehydrorhamnose 3,5-epimerase [bacterium]
MPFAFHPLELPGLVLVEPRTFGDRRGYFRETFERRAFSEAGLPADFVQDNCSFSRRGVLRGLHYQLAPRAQGKLVMALSGEIFDVGVDIRPGSPTYGRWRGVVLSEENGRLLYLPPGFAHGFCVLSETALVFYKVTADYAPELDRGIAWNDPVLGIEWPVERPVLSEKDRSLPLLDEAENNYSGI